MMNDDLPKGLSSSQSSDKVKRAIETFDGKDLCAFMERVTDDEFLDASLELDRSFLGDLVRKLDKEALCHLSQREDESWGAFLSQLKRDDLFFLLEKGGREIAQKFGSLPAMICLRREIFSHQFAGEVLVPLLNNLDIYAKKLNKQEFLMLFEKMGSDDLKRLDAQFVYQFFPQLEEEDLSSCGKDKVCAFLGKWEPDFFYKEELRRRGLKAHDIQTPSQEQVCAKELKKLYRYLRPSLKEDSIQFLSEETALILFAHLYLTEGEKNEEILLPLMKKSGEKLLRNTTYGSISDWMAKKIILDFFRTIDGSIDSGKIKKELGSKLSEDILFRAKRAHVGPKLIFVSDDFLTSL
jgi:hypothetical protein